MQSLLDKEFLDNTIRNYLYVAGIIIVALFIKRVISRLIAGFLYKLITKPGKQMLRSSFLNLVVQPLDVFLVLFISFIALDKLNFPQVLSFEIYKINFRHIVDSIANTTLIVTFIWLCLRLIDFVALILADKAAKAHDLSENQLVVFFKDFFKVLLVIIGVLLVLRFSFHKNIGNLLTGLSIVGAAVALATRESLENLIASFIIFFDKPFITGDTVKVHNFTGTVEKIGLRSTRIRTDQKTFITVPNKQMVDSILDNVTLRTQRKVELRLELGLSASVQQLTALTPAIKNILQQKPAIESNAVYLMDTGKNAHIFAVDYFTTMPQAIDEFNKLREEVNLAVIALLNKMKIELAAASTDVHVKNIN